MLNNIRSIRSSLWIPVSLGMALFISLGGLTILPPDSLGWLMRGFLDPPTYQLGWEFFRDTPWMFPLGANPDYGMALGSSIVFSDSLPLFALPFKLLGPVLPDTFQYFGLWILVCFILQAVFGYLVFSRFTSNRWLLMLGTSLLLLMPAYLMRMTIHLSIAGQWLLLAGFYLYFSERFRGRFWVCLLIVAVFVHAYLLVMLGAIWAADLLQRLVKREHGFGQSVVQFIAGIALVILVMWLLGYFMLGPAPLAEGYYARMNILALVDSRGEWSRFIPPPHIDIWDGDGFAYMGAGMLGLLVFALGLLRRKPDRKLARSALWPLVLMSVSLLIIALTDTINFGPHTIAKLNYPETVTKFFQVFRSPGRFFWPVYYLLGIFAIVLACTRLSKRFAIFVLCAGLLVQIYDLSKMLLRMHGYFAQESSWQSPLSAPMWDELGGRYSKILYFPPHNAALDFLTLAEFANRSNMSINIGNFARVDIDKEKNHQEELLSAIGSGRLNPEAIYVFKDMEHWQLAQSNMGPDSQAGILDGFKLILPDFKKCSDCQRRGFSENIVGVWLWPASQLPSLVGELRDNRLVARLGVQGYLSYGPYIRVPAGRLEYAIIYSSEAASGVEVGTWDIVSDAVGSSEVLANGSLTGTAGQERMLRGTLSLEHGRQQSEIRTFSNGEYDLQLIRVEVKPK